MAEPNISSPAPSELQQTRSTELEVVKPENENDPRYFTLKTPIEVEGRTIKYLLLDPDAGGLSGRDLLKFNTTYERRFPEEVRNQMNPYARYLSPNFLSLVIAKLNMITPEDIWNRIPYKQLNNLWPQAAVFQFSGNDNTTE